MLLFSQASGPEAFLSAHQRCRGDIEGTAISWNRVHPVNNFLSDEPQPRRKDLKRKTAHLRLQHAAITLAAQQPVQSLTVTDVSREAGLTRDTFYRYAASPIGLVAEVFDTDLQSLEESPVSAPIGDGGSRDFWQEPTLSWLRHVKRYEQVYREALRPYWPPELKEPLASHTHHMVMRFARSHPEHVPSVEGRTAHADEVSLIAWYAVFGAIGIVERILTISDDLNEKLVMEIIQVSATGWLFFPPRA